MIHEFDSVVLIVALPADALFDSALPDGEGLVPGDRGAVVDTAHAPAAYAVEFFRNGASVALADVTPNQVRVIAPAPAPPRDTAIHPPAS